MARSVAVTDDLRFRVRPAESTGATPAASARVDAVIADNVDTVDIGGVRVELADRPAGALGATSAQAALPGSA
jgi:hypothetical protein